MSARVPRRSITPAGWGWRWSIDPTGPSGAASGWSLTRAGALRASALRLAVELDLYHRHVEATS